MTPFHFGNGPRRLFGLYTPAQSGAASTRAALLCAPWGQEYLRSHRSMRLLGKQLAAQGWHALRFDYFGTGDSAGEFDEADLPGWEADIELALDELLDMTGARKATLVGLRLGATLAARVAVRRRREVDTLALWDPVLDGAAYLDELWRSFGPPGHSQPPAEGYCVDGFWLTPTMAAQIAGIELLPDLADWPTRSLMMWSTPPRLSAPWAEALQARSPIAQEQVASPPAWLEDRDLGAGAVPAALLQRLTQWVAA